MIVIAGGTGLIGSALSRYLVAAQRDVLVLSRNPEMARLEPGVRVAAWDGRSPSQVRPYVEEAAAVVNLIGAGIADKRWSAARKRLIRSSRVDSGVALTEAVLTAKARPVVIMQASGVGYYGAHGDETVDESTPPGDDFLARVCVAWEASTASVQDVGVRHIAARTGVVLTANGGALSRLLRVFRFGLGGQLGSGRQWFPWIHIDDQVAAMAHLLGAPQSGPFNLTAPFPVTNREFTTALGRALGRPTPWVVPGAALKLGLGEMAHSVLTGQKAVPGRLLESGFKFEFERLDPALEDIVVHM
jgi:uncharacterized protein (TIGR01777 family)